MRLSLSVLLWSGFIPGSGAVERQQEADRVSPASAILEGSRIELTQVAFFHCHDLEFPVIRCFRQADARDRHVQALASGRALTVNPYVLVYQDVNYGGTSYAISSSISDLSAFGWDDMISSFKSWNGGRPRFYQEPGYAHPSWRWAAGAWVANVGTPANDTFSSVKNDP